MSASTLPPDPTPSTGGANVLLDRCLQLHPSPEDAAAEPADADGDAPATERDPLLGGRGRQQERKRSDRSRSASFRRRKPWYRRPHPIWLFPGVLLSGLCMGGLASVEFEILTQMACREVDLKTQQSNPILPIPTADLSNLNVVEPASTTWNWLQASPRSSDADQEWATKCRKSTAVAKKATTFYTAQSMVSGILSALTTGYWGTLSDRIGRRPIMIVTTLSFAASVLGSILVATFPERFGFGFYLSFAALSGVLGGPMAINAVGAAYISDSTPSGSRANIYSVSDGLGFAGLALGPTCGTLIIRATGGFLLAMHYFDLTFRALFCLALLFIVPESLSLSRQRDEKIRRALQAESARVERNQNATTDADRSFAHRGVLRLWSQAATVFEPLTLLLPTSPGCQEDEMHRPRLPRTNLKHGQLDWNLTAVAACFFALWVVPGISAVKVMYGRFVFGWGYEEIGLYITLIAFTKLVYLLGILPLIIQRLRSSPPLPTRPRPASEVDDATATLEILSDEQRRWDAEATHLKLVHDSYFDLSLARWSMLVAILAYLVCGVPTTSPIFFLVGTGLLSAAGAALPALQSLALALSSPRDSGRLLASMGVLSGIAAEVIGPPFFGTIYVWSVEWFPALVFLTAAVWFLVALVPAFWLSLPTGEKEGSDAEA